MRYRHHGDSIVARIAVNDTARPHKKDDGSVVRPSLAVTDCPCRPAAAAVVAGLRKSLTIDDLKKITNRPPRTLAELADKIRNFWSRQC